jgi:hypothetical protein
MPLEQFLRDGRRSADTLTFFSGRERPAAYNEWRSDEAGFATIVSNASEGDRIYDLTFLGPSQAEEILARPRDLK